MEDAACASKHMSPAELTSVVHCPACVLLRLHPGCQLNCGGQTNVLLTSRCKWRFFSQRMLAKKRLGAHQWAPIGRPIRGTPRYGPDPHHWSGARTRKKFDATWIWIHASCPQWVKQVLHQPPPPPRPVQDAKDTRGTPKQTLPCEALVGIATCSSKEHATNICRQRPQIGPWVRTEKSDKCIPMRDGQSECNGVCWRVTALVKWCEARTCVQTCVQTSFWGNFQYRVAANRRLRDRGPHRVGRALSCRALMTL